MLQSSRESSVRFQLTEEAPFFLITEDLLTRIKKWETFCVQQDGITRAWIGRLDENATIHWMEEGPPTTLLKTFSAQSIKKITETKEVLTFRNHDELISGGLFPLIQGHHVIGVLCLLSPQTDYFKPGTVTWISALAGMISDNLFEHHEKSIDQLAEYEIAKILQSSLDVRDHLPKVLKLLGDVLKADAETVLGYLPAKGFDLVETQGITRPTLAKLRLFFEAGLGDKTFEKDEPVWVEDLCADHAERRPICRLDEEGYRGYLAIPLIGHNELVGVIEIFWREPRITKTWSPDFLKRVSEQIAFAMQRADILRAIRQRNEELLARNNATIEGFSRALEFRNIETAGHTRRVSQFAVRLAEHMGIPPEEWTSIRQGALLHDIGKLGIPDKILLKPESLTPDERKIMQQHVFYGYKILAPIISDRHTLDITRYHHEHWDGNGYPYGLKGENIPLTARLFTIIDVFDALSSDRPYRSAWSHSQVLHYLKEQAGHEFDPQIVKLFLEIADGMI